MNDSRVVDALQDPVNLEQVLEALGCDTRKDTGGEFGRPDGFIHCPMPDHPDRNPSVSVVPSLGLLECRSLCGTIRPLDLVIAHGRAKDRGEAAKWIEQILKIETGPPPRPNPVVDDPSLTVAQYLAMKGLPESVAVQFGLQDVKIWQAGADRGTKDCAYETGWYDAVFMPNREGRRPRIRSCAPDTSVKWAPKVRHQGVGIIDYTNDSADPSRFNYRPDAIGIDHIQPAPEHLPRMLLVEEGESDCHAMHAMGLPFVVGVPGSKFPARIAAELVEACTRAAGGDLTQLTVITWQEPGTAGAAFPRAVQQAIALRCDQDGVAPPRFAALHHGMIEGAPKDPCSLLQDRTPEAAQTQMLAAMLRCCEAAGPATAPAQAVPANVAPAHAPMQIDGHHTVPPTTVHQNAPVVADHAPALTTAPALAPAPVSAAGDDLPSLWTELDESTDPPGRDTAPGNVDGLSGEFITIPEGWAMVKVSSEGDRSSVTICSPFVVEAIERCDGEILARVAAPFGGGWNRTRVPMSVTADAGRACGVLAGVGVQVVNRQRPAVTDLLLALMRRCEDLMGAVDIPACTGWSGTPGVSQFGGIECEPVNAFGKRMFEANQRRRTLRPDTAAVAAEWAAVARELVLPGPDDEHTSQGAAALLAVGAAAAAPLVGPITELGVSIAPVVWLAGLGGGGKTITQRLVASIFSPNMPDLDGQVAYFANADMSAAALSARVDSCRDLPLILDDVTQIPPNPGSTQRGDAARIEAAAALGMRVFNRKPIERATRDGGVRATRAFRSTAIFSAEISMSSETSRAVVTAGHRRRIATIESQPLRARAHLDGQHHLYADKISRIEAIGGAPGELLVEYIRSTYADRTLRQMYRQAREMIDEIPGAELVDRTQRESIALICLGYVMLMQACGAATFTQLLEEPRAALAPYFAASATEGGATRSGDLTGVTAALHAVDDLRASNPTRFDNQMRDDAGLYFAPPTQGYYGKEIRRARNGQRRIALLDAGMKAIGARGVTSQVIEQAMSDGVCVRGQIRMQDGSRSYAYIWTLEPDAEDEPDPEAVESDEIVFDHDPHGLAAPRIPGQSAAQPSMQLDQPPLVQLEQCLDIASPAALADAATRLGRTGLDGYFESQTELRLTPGLSRMLYTSIDLTQEQRMDARFQYGSGTYLVGDGPSARANASVLKTIRMEARQELEFLQLQYQHAAEKNPEYVIPVASFPADDHPGWAKIDAIGRDAALALYTKDMNEAMYARNQVGAIDDKRPYDEAYVKAYRVNLMCRYRHPEWFIVGKDVA